MGAEINDCREGMKRGTDAEFFDSFDSVSLTFALNCVLGDLYLQKTRFASHVKMINLNIYAPEDV